VATTLAAMSCGRCSTSSLHTLGPPGQPQTGKEQSGLQTFLLGMVMRRSSTRGKLRGLLNAWLNETMPRPIPANATSLRSSSGSVGNVQSTMRTSSISSDQLVVSGSDFVRHNSVIRAHHIPVTTRHQQQQRQQLLQQPQQQQQQQWQPKQQQNQQQQHQPASPSVAHESSGPSLASSVERCALGHPSTKGDLLGMTSSSAGALHTHTKVEQQLEIGGAAQQLPVEETVAPGSISPGKAARASANKVAATDVLNVPEMLGTAEIMVETPPSSERLDESPVTTPVVSPGLQERLQLEDKRTASHPKSTALQQCHECLCTIDGAVFMLNDRAYCCQRHRLSAYHKSERQRKDAHSHSSKPHLASAACTAQTGLRATYRTWL